MSGAIPVVRATLLIVLTSPLAACATSEPINLSSQFTPPTAKWSPAGERVDKKADGSCRIQLSGVQDVRADTHSMGIMFQRGVHSADSVGWARSGIDSLSRDPRISFGEPAKVVFGIDLAKAYISSLTTEKAATVVLRANYAPNDTQIFRGDDNSLNWVNGEGETQAGLDAALARAIEALDQDIVARCARPG
jgi:hypothetical protein